MKKLLIGMLALAASAQALAATPWQKIGHPIAGSAQSIGAFSNGCIVGANALPLEDARYQVMRPDQRRYFGHPDLVMFIQRLSNQVNQLGLGTVLIGDMGMAAGGRFSSGHASHQTGLDVDIFLQLPKARWTSAQLLRPQALDLVAADGKRVVPSLWKPEIDSLIKLAAKDNDVTRIFVNPAIKQRLCEDAGLTGTGCVRCARGLPTAPICTCACAARLTALSVKISLCLRQETAAVPSCKAGSRRLRRAVRRRKRQRHRRYRPPVRHYWMSTFSKWNGLWFPRCCWWRCFLSPCLPGLLMRLPARRVADGPGLAGCGDVPGAGAGDQQASGLRRVGFSLALFHSP
ncbi:Penicillin-insensitive murein endopeptidase precursor [Cedecea neteri]|uniref:Penicillin-insensitive murein endopeptidase n=1 Tax=Cedecea neteri TaxID=158822 RepID=A0A2X3IEZ3_9ENTR|nr:Penicillin-insensitive murein endopeptidase precursor [Cedecea neteri]